jgi:hypothetical protein
VFPKIPSSFPAFRQPDLFSVKEYAVKMDTEIILRVLFVSKDQIGMKHTLASNLRSQPKSSQIKGIELKSFTNECKVVASQ